MQYLLSNTYLSRWLKKKKKGFFSSIMNFYKNIFTLFKSFIETKEKTFATMCSPSLILSACHTMQIWRHCLKQKYIDIFKEQRPHIQFFFFFLNVRVGEGEKRKNCNSILQQNLNHFQKIKEKCLLFYKQLNFTASSFPSPQHLSLRGFFKIATKEISRQISFVNLLSFSW